MIDSLLFDQFCFFFQERPLYLVEDGEDLNMFDQEEEDGWSEEEDFYDEELQ